MEIINFPRSSLTFRIDRQVQPPKTVSHKPPLSLNNARIPLDCHCRITEKKTLVAQEFVLGVNCKTERVGADSELFTEPNGDFVPICSEHHWMALKAYDRAAKGIMLYPPELGPQPERQIEAVEETFDSLRIDVVHTQGQILKNPRSIVDSVLCNRPLNALTHIDSDRYAAVIEYPIKTINANERDVVYQPDTGPVLFPDLLRDSNDLIGGLELAFVAFNSESWAEFILRVPTPITEQISVYHYSKKMRLDVRNEIIGLD